jgi:hypothetical protein
MLRTAMAVLAVALIVFLGTLFNHDPPKCHRGLLQRQRSSAKSGMCPCPTPTRTIRRWRRHESAWQVEPTQAEKTKLHQQHQRVGVIYVI